MPAEEQNPTIREPLDRTFEQWQRTSRFDWRACPRLDAPHTSACPGEMLDE